MKTIKEILPRLKANGNTYKNLDTGSVKLFKSLYDYLKKHSDKEILAIHLNIAEKTLSVKPRYDYLVKYKAMEEISRGIIFSNKK